MFSAEIKEVWVQPPRSTPSNDADRPTDFIITIDRSASVRCGGGWVRSIAAQNKPVSSWRMRMHTRIIVIRRRPLYFTTAQCTFNLFLFLFVLRTTSRKWRNKEKKKWASHTAASTSQLSQAVASQAEWPAAAQIDGQISSLRRAHDWHGLGSISASSGSKYVLDVCVLCLQTMRRYDGLHLNCGCATAAHNIVLLASTTFIRYAHIKSSLVASARALPYRTKAFAIRWQIWCDTLQRACVCFTVNIHVSTPIISQNCANGIHERVTVHHQLNLQTTNNDHVFCVVLKYRWSARAHASQIVIEWESVEILWQRLHSTAIANIIANILCIRGKHIENIWFFIRLRRVGGMPTLHK